MRIWTIILTTAVSLALFQGVESQIQNISNPTELDFDSLPQDSFRVVLAPRNTAVLSAQVSSIAMKITKQMGEAFEKDALLIQLDDIVFLADVHSNEALVMRAEAQFNAKEELFRDNVASTFELKSAEAELAEAQSKLSLAKRNLSACSIVAPYNGRVARVIVEEHEMVQPGEPLIEVVDDKVLFAKLLLPSSYFNQLRIGQRLDIDVRETESKEFAVISHIGSVIDPASSMIQVYAEVQNVDGRLRSGMIGNADGKQLLSKEKKETAERAPL